jgi:GNAT superfamily N-acetyltransferase
VQDLYVSPAHRRRGVGRALLAALCHEARTRGRGFLWWASRTWNTEAHAFFRQFATVEEPVIAFAAFGEQFERLARAALAQPTRRNTPS